MKGKRQTSTIAEAAAAIGVADKTLYRAAARGEVPVIRVGRRLLVPQGWLDAVIAGRHVDRGRRKRS